MDLFPRASLLTVNINIWMSHVNKKNKEIISTLGNGALLNVYLCNIMCVCLAFRGLNLNLDYEYELHKHMCSLWRLRCISVFPLVSGFLPQYKDIQAI